MYSPLIEQARTILAREAASWVQQGVAMLLGEGTAEWIEDPWVDGVVGLVYKGTQSALLVIYVDRNDWELSEDLWEAIE